MSAFMVDDIHISALITAALRTSRHGDTLTWYFGDLPGTVPGEALPDDTETYRDTLKRTRRQVTRDNAGQWGATLLAENRRSINHRYDEDEWEEPYVFAEITGRLDPVAILKAIDCYCYQSCEHDGWKASESRAFCDALRKRVIGWLDGYDDAPWRFTEPSQALRKPPAPPVSAPAAPARTSEPRTIPRNATRQIRSLQLRLGFCKVYTLDNCFTGQATDPANAWHALERRNGKLRDNGNGTYTVRVHSNCWYELTA